MGSSLFGAWIICIWGDVGRVLRGIMKDLEPHHHGVPSSHHLPAECSVMQICASHRETCDRPHHLPPKGHLSFISFPSWKPPPGELDREEKINIKQGIQTLGTRTWGHVTLPSFQSLAPWRARREMWNITPPIASGHDYVLVTAYKDLLGISHLTLIAFKTWLNSIDSVIKSKIGLLFPLKSFACLI